MSRGAKPLSQEIMIERFKAVGHSQVSFDKTIYKGITKTVVMTCSKHGDFEITPFTYLRNAPQSRGCKKCTMINRVNIATLGGISGDRQREFLVRAEAIHKGRYDYSKAVYISMRENVDVICSKHGLFNQKAGNHVAGVGCPKCMSRSKKSILS